MTTLVLLRLGLQNEKFRQSAAYTGALSLGFAFHLFEEAWYGTFIIIAALIWIFWISWRSSEEFQAIHEDYQRASKGLTSMYTEHYRELKQTRKQLSAILALPIFGFAVVVLGIPPRMNPNAGNFMILIIYLAVAICGVYMLLKLADSMYRILYAKIDDLAHRTSLIEADLGDPARLLHELAREGLNLSALEEEEVSDDG